MCVAKYVHMNACAHSAQKRVSHLMKLLLQDVVGCLTWVLETELRFSAKVVCDVNARAIFLFYMLLP